MADQVLKYKIELDDSDLAQQLQAIRDRINSEVTSFTAASMTNTPLVTQNGAGIAMLPPETGAFSLPAPSYPSYVFPPQQTANFSNSFDGDLFQNQVPDQQGTFADAGRQAAMIMQSVPRNVSASMNGAWADLQSFGQNVQTGLADTMPNTQPGGFIANAFASAGFGYDQRLPMYLSDYREAALQEAGRDMQKGGEAVASFGIDAGIGIAGWAVGAGVAALGAPLLAPWVGGTVALGGLAKLGLDLTSVESYSELRDTAEGLQTMGTMQLGAFSKADAMATATMMRDYSKSEEGYLKDINMEDIESAVGSFASAGGLQGVRSADELKDKVETVMKNFREVMHILGTTQEEAASIMGEMERRQLVSAGGMPDFAISMKAQGMYAGLSGVDLMQSGLQVADQFRGTGIGQAAGFQMGIDATMETARLANSLDPYYRKNIYEMGGQQAAAQTLVTTVTNTMNGSDLGNKLGLTYEAGGADALSKSIQEQMGILSSYMSQKGPEGYFAAKGKGAAIFEGLDLATQTQALLAYAYQAGKLIAPGAYDKDGNIDQTSFLGIAQTVFANEGAPQSIETLKLWLNTGRVSKTLKDSDVEAKAALLKLDTFDKEQDYTFSDYMRLKVGGLEKPFDPIGAWLEEKYHNFGIFVKETAESASDATFGRTRLRSREISESVDGDLFKEYLQRDTILRDVDLGSQLYNTTTGPGFKTSDDNKTYKGLSEKSKNLYRTLSSSYDGETALEYLQANEITDKKTKEVSYKKDLSMARRDLGYWNDIQDTSIGHEDSAVQNLLGLMTSSFSTMTANGTFKYAAKDSSSEEYAKNFMTQLLPGLTPNANTAQALLYFAAKPSVKKDMAKHEIQAAASIGEGITAYDKNAPLSYVERVNEYTSWYGKDSKYKEFQEYASSLVDPMSLAVGSDKFKNDMNNIDILALIDKYKDVDTFKSAVEKTEADIGKFGWSLDSLFTSESTISTRQKQAKIGMLPIIPVVDRLSTGKTSMDAYVNSNLQLTSQHDFRSEDAAVGGRNTMKETKELGYANIEDTIEKNMSRFTPEMNLDAKLDAAAKLFKDSKGNFFKGAEFLDEGTLQRVYGALSQHSLFTDDNYGEWDTVLTKRRQTHGDGTVPTGGVPREESRKVMLDKSYNYTDKNKSANLKDEDKQLADLLQEDDDMRRIWLEHRERQSRFADGGELYHTFTSLEKEYVDLANAAGAANDPKRREVILGKMEGIRAAGGFKFSREGDVLAIEKRIVSSDYYKAKAAQINASGESRSTIDKMLEMEKSAEAAAIVAGNDLIRKANTNYSDLSREEQDTMHSFWDDKTQKFVMNSGLDGSKALMSNYIKQGINMDLGEVIKKIQGNSTDLTQDQRNIGNALIAKGPEAMQQASLVSKLLSIVDSGGIKVIDSQAGPASSASGVAPGKRFGKNQTSEGG